MRLLLEMNHEVRGDFVEETVEQVPRYPFYKILFRIEYQVDLRTNMQYSTT
jgi:hypothetical protein